MPTNNDGHYEVVWPRSERRLGVKPLAKRLESLEGKKIASMAEAEAKAKTERQKRESRDSQLRAMFRKKLFEE